MLTQQRTTTTRFRCGHCGNRLVMHNRHLRRLVACHGCGRATHPVAKRLGAITPPAAKRSESDKRQHALATAPATPAQPAPQPAPAPAIAPQRVAAARPVLELSAAPLVPLALFGATGVAFFAAVSLMSYVGGFVSALLLVAVAAVGLRWLRRGTLSVRARLQQIETLRLRHGTFRVAAMLLAWLWSQPPRRKPWACVLVLGWGAVYVPYCLSGMLLPASRGGTLRVAA